LKSQM